jgi:ABC-type antimicrobial peptide transport system permease subunit
MMSLIKAWSQFRSYPLQSVLIILAIALGVAVVTMVAASLQATNNLVAEQNDQLWSREMRLQAKKNDWSAFYQGAKPIPVREVGLLSDQKVILNIDDLAKAKEVAPLVDYAYLSDWTSLQKMQDDDSTLDLEITSATADYVKAAKLKVTKGSLPSETDFAEQRKVIVLSTRALEQLGLSEDIVDQSVQFTNWDGAPTDYTVIGILEKPA